jgi:hypothetical protein
MPRGDQTDLTLPSLFKFSIGQPRLPQGIKTFLSWNDRFLPNCKRANR